MVLPLLVHDKKSLAGSNEDAITGGLIEKATRLSQGKDEDGAAHEDVPVEDTARDGGASVETGPEDEESFAGDIDEGHASVSQDGTEEDEVANNDSEAEQDAIEEDAGTASLPDQVANHADASPVGLNQRIQMPPLEIHPSSPIRPAMILKRKLLDNALLQRDVKVQKPSVQPFIAAAQPKKSELNQEQEWPPAQRQVLHHSLHKTIDTGTDKYVVQSPRTILANNNGYQKVPAPEWAVPIRLPHPGPTRDARSQCVIERPKGQITLVP